MTNQQRNPEEEEEMFLQDEMFSEPDTSTKDPSNPTSARNAEPEEALSDYQPDEKWIAKNEKYFRRSKVFAAWRKLDRQIARTIAEDILKFIWSGGNKGNYVLHLASDGDNRIDDGVQVVDLPNYDMSKPVGCQYLWPGSISTCRLKNIEKQIIIWMELFDWELSYLRLYHENKDLKFIWEVKVPNNWAE